MCTVHKLMCISVYNLRLPKTILKSWYTFSNMHMQHMVGKVTVEETRVKLVVSWERGVNSK